MKREQLQGFVKRSEKVSGVLTVKDRVCDTGDRASDPAPSECPDTPRSAGQSFHWKHLLVCNLLSSQQTEMNALERKLLSVMWTFLKKNTESRHLEFRLIQSGPYVQIIMSRIFFFLNVQRLYRMFVAGRRNMYMSVVVMRSKDWLK